MDKNDKSKDRNQITMSMPALEARQLDDAAELQGIRRGTLVNSLWEAVFPLLREHRFLVYRLKESLPSFYKIGDSSAAAAEAKQSKLEQWTLGLLHYLESEDELEDLLQFADKKRYKRPDVHLTNSSPRSPEATKKGPPGRNTKRTVSH